MGKGCFFCGLNKNLTKHHVIPKSFGGTEIEDYQITVCRKCHNKIHTELNRLLNPTFEDILRGLIKFKTQNKPSTNTRQDKTGALSEVIGTDLTGSAETESINKASLEVSDGI